VEPLAGLTTGGLLGHLRAVHHGGVRGRDLVDVDGHDRGPATLELEGPEAVVGPDVESPLPRQRRREPGDVDDAAQVDPARRAPAVAEVDAVVPVVVEGEDVVHGRPVLHDPPAALPERA
jgi:hypothetical protein